MARFWIMDKEVKAYLEKNSIAYTWYEHPAVFTCEDAAIHCKHVPGIPVKNLFLRDKEHEAYFLVVLPDHKRLKVHDLEKQWGVKKLRFGTPDELRAMLGLEPGSVSPLGLVHDTENAVQVLVDEEVWNADAVSIHPNINTASLAVPRESFRRMMESFGNRVEIVEL